MDCKFNQKEKKNMTVDMKTTKDGHEYLEFTTGSGYVLGSRKNKNSKTASPRIYKNGKCRYCGVEKNKPHLLAKGGLEYYHGMEDMLGNDIVVWEKKQ